MMQRKEALALKRTNNGTGVSNYYHICPAL
jgi:hypothetical protein